MSDKEKEVLEEAAEEPIQEEAAMDTDTKAKEEAPEEPDFSPIAVPDTDITEKKLAAYKETYGKLYVTDYMGSRYVWRRLTQDEFTTIAEDTDHIEDDDELVSTREKEFCKLCVLYPGKEQVEKDTEDDMITTRVAREILFRSGFFPPRPVEL